MDKNIVKIIIKFEMINSRQYNKSAPNKLIIIDIMDIP